MEENEVLESSATEEVATPQQEENTQVEETITEQGENEEITAPQQEVVEPQEQQQPQSPEVNAQYAKMRRDYEQRGMDRAIAELGLEFNGQPIKTFAEFQNAKRQEELQAEAERQGIDPKFYKDFNEMQDKVANYEKEKTFSQQDRELSQDEVRGQYYAECKDEVKEMADNFGVDLRTAFTLYIDQNLDKILSKATQKIQNETIEKINKNTKSTPGALGNPNESKTLNAWDLSDEEFKAMRENALSGGLRY